jgi:hypothetical protein
MIIPINNTAFCLLTNDELALFCVPEHDTGNHASPILVEPDSMFTVRGLRRGFSPGMVASFGYFNQITFATAHVLHALQVDDDMGRSAGWEWDMRAADVDLMSVRGLRSCWYEDDAESLDPDVVLYYGINPSVDDTGPLVRLGDLRPGRIYAKKFPRSPSKQMWAIDYDDWSGRAIIHWMPMGRCGEPECWEFILTVISRS